MKKEQENFHGQGGSYVIDPKTQTQSLVERTNEEQVQEQVKPETKE